MHDPRDSARVEAFASRLIRAQGADADACGCDPRRVLCALVMRGEASLEELEEDTGCPASLLRAWLQSPAIAALLARDPGSGRFVLRAPADSSGAGLP